MKRDFKIFIVEDEGMLRNAIKDLLEMSGYVVETAIHGSDALEKLSTSEVLPSLILLDLNMPVMPGNVFLEKLRVVSEAHARIPVVLISAVPERSIEGVAGILRKPFGLKAILEMVQSFHGGENL